MLRTSPRKPSNGLFLVGMFVDALGNGLYVPLTLLFIHEVTGLPTPVVGAGATVAAMIGLAANPLAGVLIDRFDARAVLVGTYVIRALGFALYPLVSGFGPLVAVAAVIACGDRAFYPASAGYIAALTEGGGRDRLYALMATARNVAFGLGGLLSSLAVTRTGGYALIAVFQAASFVLASACLLLARPPRAEPGPRPRGGYRRVLADRPFMGLVAVTQAFTLTQLILSVGLPLYAVTVLGAPPAILGILYTINTLLVAVGQLPVRRLQRHARRTHAMALSGVVFIASCAVYAGAALLPPGPPLVAALVTATLVFTAAELMQATPSASLAAGAAPPALRGRYLAVHQMTWAVGQVVAPAGFSLLLGTAPPLLWAVLAALLAIASAALLRLSAHLPPEAAGRPNPPQAPPGGRTPDHAGT
ncbi:MFS transporter [Bailinhaonella thermotolerans]|uniref:MFS transporter n=1 Tax=Bailinhaonella thermotolerans TaxID=1070861 RepID=A0A3A4BBL9_9ACTN|nr:MFS transporter [Bailinhaonella thermotolerans]RJL35496.1 MFS transporter [Bailinhaonella thermotolerans]